MILHEDENLEVWDAHTHFSNLIARPLKFLFKKLAIYEIMDLNFANWSRFKRNSADRTEKNVKLYEQVLDFYHIDKAIHLPVFKLDRKLSYRMNELLPERIFGFGYVNPNSRHLDSDLSDLLENDVLGIKLHPHLMKFTFLSHVEELLKIFHFCAEHKIIILSHTGSHSALKNVVPLLKKSEETVFIIGHSGLCPQVDQALEVARNCPNSYLEISGNPYNSKFMEAIKDPAIGMNKILFGTDLPSLHPRVEMEKILSLPISVEEKRMILSKNLQGLMKKFLGNKFTNLVN